MQCWSRLAWVHSGVVGVDVKSHQDGADVPFAAIVQGNEAQDKLCDEVRSIPRPADVRRPSGGFFAGLSIGGFAVTSPPAKAIRGLMRDQAVQEWRKRAVQGKVGRMGSCLFAPTLDLRVFTCCKIEERWQSLLLPSDVLGQVDLSRVLFRALRAIGGGWTEMLNMDEELKAFAGRWAEEEGLEFARTCPLCRAGAGTPRHTVMQCEDLRPLADHIRDLVEAELGLVAQREKLLQAAADYWDEEEERG